MRNMFKRMFIAAAILLLPSICLAVPGVINYQGRLTDDTGVPLTGNMPMAFFMYTTTSGGTPIWTESLSVTVSNGAFSVYLGELNPVPVSVFERDDIYLGVAVDPDPEMVPRQRLGSSGYAHKAAGVMAGERPLGPLAPVMVNMTGTGSGGDFRIQNPSNPYPAVYGYTDGPGNALCGNSAGSGKAVYGSTSGTGSAVQGFTTGTGNAGWFEVNNATSKSAAVFGQTDGEGNAGNFIITNGANTDDALYVTTLGSGNAVHGTVDATGTAAKFDVSNSSNTSAAVDIATEGLGRAAQVSINNISNGNAAFYASTNGSGAAVAGYNSGTGEAGHFKINNVDNSSDALNVFTLGSGYSGYFAGGKGVRIANGNLVVGYPTVPATSRDPGEKGQIAYDNNYIYICISTDTWKRVVIDSW